MHHGDGGDAEAFVAEVTYLDGVAVVRVRGEIDISTRDQLARALRQACDAASTLVVDLTGSTFMDLAGVDALVEARRHLGSQRAALTVRSARPAVRTLLAFTGLEPHLVIQDD